MKIIKPGMLPELRVLSATCFHCKCEFEFQQVEAKFVSSQRDGSYYAIPCPTCHREVTVVAAC